MTTIAETIAARFGNEARRFKDASGASIWDACFEEACNTQTFGELECSRYEFDDASAIVVCPNAGWGVGFSGHRRQCICWQSEPPGGCACPEHDPDWED